MFVTSISYLAAFTKRTTTKPIHRVINCNKSCSVYLILDQQIVRWCFRVIRRVGVIKPESLRSVMGVTLVVCGRSRGRAGSQRPRNKQSGPLSPQVVDSAAL